jgi:transposase-like protein
MSIAKTRQRRTKPWTAAEASRVVDEFESSGMGLEQFAIANGFSPSRLTRWRQRLGRAPSTSTKKPRGLRRAHAPTMEMVELVPASDEVPAAPNSRAPQEQEDDRIGLLVTLRSGCQIRLEASLRSTQLRSLIEVLDSLKAQGE